MGFVAEELSFAFAERPVIRDLSMDLPAGRFHAILGPNGCGKTTLLDLLSGHRRPDGGRIAYNGKDLSGYSKRSLAREMALVPQYYHINFPFTAREVVMMGRYPHIPRFARPSAEDLDRVDRVMAMTGTDRLAGRYVSELSGGERQRVIFARALAQDTPVLILDEATSNLDVNHIIALFNLTAAAVRESGKTVIAVLQDINLAALFCDHLVFMRDGEVRIQGPVAEVLTPETIREIFDVPVRVRYDDYAAANQVVFRK